MERGSRSSSSRRRRKRRKKPDLDNGHGIWDNESRPSASIASLHCGIDRLFVVGGLLVI